MCRYGPLYFVNEYKKKPRSSYDKRDFPYF